ncbi:MAG: virulence factor [Anaerolineae bacterium]|nr:virulence factor [Anaerolineae bacterium]
MMATYEVLYWHDLPSQVRAKGTNPRDRISVQLSQRFQEAIDAAAMAAKLIGTDDYLAMYQWGEMMERHGTPQEVAAAVAAEIEAQYPGEIDWRATADALRYR